MAEPGSGDGRWYAPLYRAALGTCGGIISTAAGLLAAQRCPGPALLWVWTSVTAVLAITTIIFCDRVAAACARAVLTRIHRERS